MKIALLQLNPTVGDLRGNADLILKAALRAARADLVVTSELALLGYPPRDLLLNADFVQRSWSVLHCLAGQCHEAGLPPLLVGLAERNPDDVGRPLFNSAALLKEGRVERTFQKTLLPTYDVFDEDRYFEPAHEPQLLELGGMVLGISICEDIWNDRDLVEAPSVPHGSHRGTGSGRSQGCDQPLSLALYCRKATAPPGHALPHGQKVRCAIHLRKSGGRK